MVRRPRRSTGRGGRGRGRARGPRRGGRSRPGARRPAGGRPPRGSEIVATDACIRVDAIAPELDEGAPLLAPAFCAGDVADVARALLGQVLRAGPVWLRIAETEAYGGRDDSASHARMGVTARNRPMWGPPGHAYVYLVYGLHSMVNVTAEAEGRGAAVLVRAAEPIAGLDVIAARRGGRTGPDALDGPGKVAAALGATVEGSGAPLYLPGGLELRAGEPPAWVRVGPRVGIDYASPRDRAAALRFAIAGSRWVGHARTLGPPRPVG